MYTKRMERLRDATSMKDEWDKGQLVPANTRANSIVRSTSNMAAASPDRLKTPAKARRQSKASAY